MPHKPKKNSQSPSSQRSQSAARSPLPPDRRTGVKVLRFRLRAELLEDAHPGSGAGDAGIDALVARNREGKPVIWATHLSGVLREAACRSLGSEKTDLLFGKAGGQRGLVLLTSLYLEEDRGVRVWRSAARASYINRAPKDETLRALEFVAKGSKFAGELEIPEERVHEVKSLLLDVPALGHGRASGAGRLRFSLEKIGRSTGEALRSQTGTGNATRLLLLLRNRDPLTITATAVPSNLIPALPYIPGRALLGALAAWLHEAGQTDQAQTLTDGSVSIGDALPLPEELDSLATKGGLAGLEVCPAPLSLKSPKPMQSVGVFPWWAMGPTPVQRLDEDLTRRGSEPAESKLKRPEPDLFVCRLEQTKPWLSFRPSMRVRLRNGRPQQGQEEPSLFAIEQIAEQTLFLAELTGAPRDLERLATALAQVLTGGRWIRIGRGGAPVEVVRTEWANARGISKTDGTAYLILTSDLLVRDEWLRWITELRADNLTQIPGWPQEARRLEATVVAQEQTEIRGFNGTSRLWRLPAGGIRRGTVIRLQGTGLEAFSRAASRGLWLGERTHEGFGRFRVDSQLPGVTSTTEDLGPKNNDCRQDDALLKEHFAGETRAWLPERLSGDFPGLSQWMGLLEDLERNAPDVFSSRLTPSTAGKRCWNQENAHEILLKINTLHDPKLQLEYARMVTRWLRPRMQQKEAP